MNFRPLEVVGRGSETQLEEGEKLNKITVLFVFFVQVRTLVLRITGDVMSCACMLEMVKNSVNVHMEK